MIEQRALRTVGLLGAFLILAGLGCASVPLEDPIESSLPGLGFPSATVAKGVLKAESAYLTQENASGTGVVQLRYGLTQRTELQVGMEEVQIARNLGGEQALLAGGMLQLIESPSGLLPELALHTLGGVPVSGSGREFSAFSALAAGWDLGRDVGFASSVSYGWKGDGDLTVAGGVGVPLPLGLGGALDYAWDRAGSRPVRNYHSVVASIGRPVTHDLALDFWTGVHDVGGNRDILFGIGLARRW
jgi:hypothetical protein